MPPHNWRATLSGCSDALQREGNSLTDTDAHGRESELAAGALQLLSRGECEARPRHPKRMPKCDRTTIWIHVLSIVGETKLPKNGERLRSERFIKFNHVEI